MLMAVLFAAVGGHGCSKSPAQPEPVAAAPVYDSGTPGVTLPTVVQEVKPQYTAEAIANRIQGAVLLSAVVMRDGTVGEVNVIRSLDTTYGLDASAVFAAKQWRFNPGMKDGVPVAVRVTIEMTFTLR